MKEINTKDINDCNQEEIKIYFKLETKKTKKMFNSSLISLVSHRELQNLKTIKKFFLEFS